ncbi:hypothetical protein F5Y16DRAFT_179268 [Xylariaceae sp. FL0255]|nr:hypothetical protein F5Y16DRAFT_179268 [Xylariaceae sp. FL0255]
MSSNSDGRGRGRNRNKTTGGSTAERIQFFGSQVGGKSVINYSYTDLPWRLVLWDIQYFFIFSWALPWIIWPLRPCDGAYLDELALTAANLWCIIIHFLLIIFQLSFLLALPVALILPTYLFGASCAIFFGINWLLCRSLNGDTIIYKSDPKYAEARPEHQHEQWIFLNGVAVGETWLKSNINRLALTFRRPVLGIHNRTSGIIFDVIECLIQRNFSYATSDVRLAYKTLKETLYNPQYSKVVFILHSQGGIEGGLVLDWLLQELPQDLLAKLEVYTFGNAANHFNNPHRHVESQGKQQQQPKNKTEVPAIMTKIPITESPVEMKLPALKKSQSLSRSAGSPQPLTSATNGGGSSKQSSQTFTVPASDRAIGHVEHYAHTTDFVALWGLLHFVTNARASPEMPRFIGRVFSRTSSRGGHQFCQHYLNGMFPLARDPATGEFVGCADRNDFMDSVVERGEEGTEQRDAREGFDNSWALLELEGRGGAGHDVEIHGSFHGDEERIQDGKVRVRHLSRLWLYRNGRSPPEISRSLMRGATM